MNSWTDGTDMNFADHVGGQWPEGIEKELSAYPVISRHEMVKRHQLSDTPDYLFKFTHHGEDFAFCKLYCGDLGYYRVAR
jgi:hypothetical protein